MHCTLMSYRSSWTVASGISISHMNIGYSLLKKGRFLDVNKDANKKKDRRPISFMGCIKLLRSGKVFF